MSTSLQCKNETSARATVWASPPPGGVLGMRPNERVAVAQRTTGECRGVVRFVLAVGDGLETGDRTIAQACRPAGRHMLSASSQ